MKFLEERIFLSHLFTDITRNHGNLEGSWKKISFKIHSGFLNKKTPERFLYLPLKRQGWVLVGSWYAPDYHWQQVVSLLNLVWRPRCTERHKLQWKMTGCYCQYKYRKVQTTTNIDHLETFKIGLTICMCRWHSGRKCKSVSDIPEAVDSIFNKGEFTNRIRNVFDWFASKTDAYN